jgi:uncharacterized membrane protein
MTTTFSPAPPPAVKSGEGTKVTKTCTIRRTPEELYHFWRQFENLPKVMPHLLSVTQVSQRESHWVAKGPLGKEIEWDAEVINETENRLIAWRTKPGAALAHAGTVRFEPVGGGAATEVTVTLEYDPPGGVFGDMLARLVGKDPGREVAEMLDRLKKLVEF